MAKKILKTQNKEWGFWGTTAQHYTNKETQQRWNDAFETLLLLKPCLNYQVQTLNRLENYWMQGSADTSQTNVLEKKTSNKLQKNVILTGSQKNYLMMQILKSH